METVLKGWGPQSFPFFPQQPVLATDVVITLSVATVNTADENLALTQPMYTEGLTVKPTCID